MNVNRNIKRPVQILAIVGMLSHAAFVAAQSETADPILQTMQQELKRSMEGLRFEDYPAPYFIAMGVRATVAHTLGARGGALFRDRQEADRHAFVDVRVGDYTLDNGLDTDGQSYDEMMLHQAPVELPLDEHPEALRNVLWALTDQRYKEALASYHRVKGKRVYQVEQKTPVMAFSKEEPITYIGPSNTGQFDRERMAHLCRQLSAQIAQHPHIFDSVVDFEVRFERRYLINSEGTTVRADDTIFGLHARVYTLAPDGMLLDHSMDLYARTEQGIPPLNELQSRVDTLISQLMALRNADVLEPYTGPAILEPAATGVFFHEAIGHRLEGARQDNDQEGRTFAGQVGKLVLPNFLTVIDDPTLTTAATVPLNGSYIVDDEGVLARPVVLVQDGILKEFLLSRRPIEGFARSNGHGRAQGIRAPVARMGNLIVTASNPVDRAELKKRLLKEVRQQQKPFGLIIGDITGGSTNTQTYGYQAFKGSARMVWKVDAKSGEETLVRGVEIVGTPLSSINKIIAASNETGVFNGYCGAESGYVPVSTVAPATLFREIELQRSGRQSQKDRVLPPPTTE